MDVDVDAFAAARTRAHLETYDASYETYDAIAARATAEASARALRYVPPKPPLARRVVFAMGGPGAGVATQCAKLAAERGEEYVHVRVGDVLRRAGEEGVERDTEVGALIRGMRVAKALVPTEIVLRFLREEMDALRASNKCVLIEGFPRTLEQAIAFEAKVRAVDFVLFFDGEPETMALRLLKPGRTITRASVERRYEHFVETYMPIVEHYKSEGMVHSIAADASVEEVNADALDAVALENMTRSELNQMRVTEAATRRLENDPAFAGEKTTMKPQCFFSHPFPAYLAAASAKNARDATRKKDEYQVPAVKDLSKYPRSGSWKRWHANHQKNRTTRPSTNAGSVRSDA